MEDIKDDDIVKNSHIISLNETHLGHSDILTPDMMGISKDVLIVCCHCNNKGGGVALIVMLCKAIAMLNSFHLYI